MSKPIYWGSAHIGVHPEEVCAQAQQIPEWVKSLWSAVVGGDMIALAQHSQRQARLRTRNAWTGSVVAVVGVVCFLPMYLYLAGCEGFASVACSLLPNEKLPIPIRGAIFYAFVGSLMEAMGFSLIRLAWKREVLNRLFLYGKGLIVFRIVQVIGPNPSDLKTVAAAKLIEIAVKMSQAANDMNNALHDFTRRQAEDAHGGLWRRFDELRAIFADGHLVSPSITPTELLQVGQGEVATLQRTEPRGA